MSTYIEYSHLSNYRGGWNKRGGWNIFMKSINVEGGIFFVEGEIFQNRQAWAPRLLER